MVGRPASSIETQAGSGESFAFGVAGLRLDEGGEERGRSEEDPVVDHLSRKPEGADEILVFGGAKLADRQWRDGSGVQDLDQAPVMQIGFALEGRRSSCRVVDTRAATHPGPLARVLA